MWVVNQTMHTKTFGRIPIGRGDQWGILRCVRPVVVREIYRCTADGTRRCTCHVASKGAKGDALHRLAFYAHKPSHSSGNEGGFIFTNHAPRESG